ncbi:hypothetical protein BVRB_5g124260 [Beta vulgaris subsp. vulgaris]|uniref:Uncharacterized protein n=1 Tax=Beta vulgaris subsp. vulgaris TaxID=3555 RepID=A0A0J8E3Q4_BETVV|nr:hypothetical protein BVRB_5g124260 [Beta vulgaris subsp. vulgaris]
MAEITRLKNQNRVLKQSTKIMLKLYDDYAVEQRRLSAEIAEIRADVQLTQDAVKGVHSIIFSD